MRVICSTQPFDFHSVKLANLTDPLLIKRSEQSGMQLANIGEEPPKGKRVYTSIMETSALSHLRSKGYGEIELPYDLYCPSIQKKLQSWVGTGINAYFLGARNF